MLTLDETHDPALTTFVSAAQAPDADFTIQNLPYGVFRRRGSGESFRVGVAIGDAVIDLSALIERDVFDGTAREAANACRGDSLNAFMALGHEAWTTLRRAVSRVLRTGSAQEAAVRASLVPMAECEHALPARIGDYTDFYASVHHATNVGRMFRPDQPLLPNYKWVPIAYHGRASSVAVSPQAFHRPVGQRLPPGADAPVVSPSARLDYELEVGIFIGTGNPLGTRIPVATAETHVFGLCLLNDWSAREVQAWEYQPLGPFLAKNFATTISPWIVTLDALAPYRVAWTRPAEDPAPLPYLDDPDNRTHGAFDVELEVLIATARMRAEGRRPHRLSHSNFRDSYWNVAQMVTHHTVNGCNLQPGDLFGSGTQSGAGDGQMGSLLELSAGGKKAIDLGNGESRRFLEDGDQITLHAFCAGPGKARVGFGTAMGEVLPATAM